MKILSTLFFLLSLSSVSAAPIVCIKAPKASMLKTGSFSETIQGPAITISFSDSEVGWVSTGGSMVSVDGKNENGKITFTKVSGRKPTYESILETKSSILGEGLRVSITLQDSLGGKGYLFYNLEVLAGFNTATWEDENGSTEKFHLCAPFEK